MKNLWYLTPMCSDHLTDTDGLLSSMSNGADSWEYTYDAAGNITKIVCGEKSITYQYDELNQLIRENNGVLGITVLYPVLRRKPRPT